MKGIIIEDSRQTDGIAAKDLHTVKCVKGVIIKNNFGCKTFENRDVRTPTPA